VSSDRDKNSNGNEPSKTSGEFDFFSFRYFAIYFLDTSAVVPVKSSVPKSFDSDSEDGLDSVPPKKGIFTYSSLIVS
jgi:hypothetical protein